jgi:hypothetical protein
MIPPLEKQLIETIHQLDTDSQQKVLDFARDLMTPRGVDGKTLLEFAGKISSDDLDKMEEAIADLEKINPNDW